MVFNATFNNISAVLWRSILLVEETGVPAKNHPPSTSWLLYRVHLATWVVIGTDWKGSCKSNLNNHKTDHDHDNPF
jgi:hypothetical protein